MPSGGARPGAGRKRKTDAERWLAGNPSGSAQVVTKKPSRYATRLLPAPDGLTEGEVAVWNRLAPWACACRTLVPGTADAFGMLCRAIVLEGELSRNQEKRGEAAHRGLMQRVEAWMLRFRLSPMGKELDVPEDGPADAFAEFDEPGGVQ